MEADSCDYDKQKKEHRNLIPDDSDIPEPLWLRRIICGGDGVIRGLLDYNIYLLCVGTPILLGFFLLA